MTGSSECYLDAMAVLEEDPDSTVDKVMILQEAALSLLISGDYAVCLTVCKQLQEVTNVQQKRRTAEDSSFSVLVTSFLLGKVYHHLGELRQGRILCTQCGRKIGVLTLEHKMIGKMGNLWLCIFIYCRCQIQLTQHMMSGSVVSGLCL